MTVYRIEPDHENFMYFALDDYELLSLMPDFDIFGFGFPLEFEWVEPSGRFYEADTGAIAVPEVTLWSSRLLVANSKARKALESFMTQDIGQWLPCSVEGIQYWLFNPCVALDNAFIDQAKSHRELDEFGGVTQVRNVTFRDCQIEAPLFTVDYDVNSTIYASEECRRVFTNLGLKGVEFNPS